MIDWDVWQIKHEKTPPNDNGLYLLDIRGIIHEKLEPGHQVREIRRVIPMGPDADVNKKLKEFSESLK